MESLLLLPLMLSIAESAALHHRRKPVSDIAAMGLVSFGTIAWRRGSYNSEGEQPIAFVDFCQ